MYEFCTNNSLFSYDKNGLFAFLIGFSLDAGASTGISLGFSFGFSYSKKEGLSIGFTKTGALGSFVGINASANLQLSFSPTASSMSKLGGTSIVVGGSKGAGLSVGGSVAIPPDAEKRK